MTGKDLMSTIKHALPSMSLEELQRTEDQLNLAYMQNREQIWKTQKIAEGKIKDSTVHPIDLDRIQAEPGLGLAPLYIDFGRYSTGEYRKKEPIHWQVLGTDNGKTLLLSAKVLDHKPLNKEYCEFVSWADSTLRTWLNSRFLHAAFTKNELHKIIPLQDGTSDDADASTVLLDRVFLLNEQEQKALGVPGCGRPFDSGDHWLRSDVKKWKGKVCDMYGHTYEKPCHTSYIGIRPAIWVRKDSIKSLQNRAKQLS